MASGRGRSCQLDVSGAEIPMNRYFHSLTSSHRTRSRQTRFHGVLEALETRALLSITFDIRYNLDANNFFDTQAKKDGLQRAANALGAVLSDHLAAIFPFGGNPWSAAFQNPATGALQSLPNLVVPADTMILFV